MKEHNEKKAPKFWKKRIDNGASAEGETAQENTGKKKKRLTKKQTALVVLCSVLAVILLLLILGTAYMESMFGLINRDSDNSTLSQEEYEALLQQWADEDGDGTGPTLDPEDVTWGGSADLMENGDEIINILLIGQDRRPGQGRQRSDAMILCTINTKNKSLTMTSFMRDLYVQIPGYQDDRINHCYPLGGMDLLDECLKVNFGVQVDGNVEVDFGGFEDIIDLMGGVDIELTSAEANHLNGRYGYATSVGMNHLNGEQALSYSRIRYIGNGDFGRTNRQRTVMTALIENCRDMSLTQLNSLAKEVLPLVTTDMTNTEIINYLIDLFPILSDLTITNQRIPIDGGYTGNTIRGMSVLVPDMDANRQFLRDTIGDALVQE